MIEFVIGEIPLAYLFSLVGLTLIVLEMFLGGILEENLIVLAISLIITGFIGGIFGVHDVLPLTLILAVVGVITFFIYRRIDLYGEPGNQTSTSDDLKGKTGVVTEEVGPEEGKVKLKDDRRLKTYYEARSVNEETIPKGSDVIVEDPRGGNVLEVRRK